MASSLKRKLSSEIKTVTKTDVQKTDVLISGDQKQYLKTRKRVAIPRFVNQKSLKAKKRVVKDRLLIQSSGLVNSNFNYYISSPAMTSYYNDNYRIPESNNNPGVVAEWRPHPNVYHPARIPVAAIAPQMRTPLNYTRALITADPVVASVGQPVMVPEIAPTFCPHLYGYPWTHKVPYIQDTSVQEPYIQDPNTQESYIQERYTQQPYLQYPYMQQLYVQQPYVRHLYVHQPYALQPYVQQPYVQQPYVQQAYTQEPSMQSPSMQNPYLTEPYEQELYTTDEVINDLSKCTLEDLASPEQTTENFIDKSEHLDPLEAYLKLPKDLFPTADKLGLDPNPFIDQCCKLGDVDDNAPWILDLELGVPISPTPRTIAIYDIKRNSIRCKHDPNIIHPGFQRCNNDFQKLILRYYKYIIKSWYKGYTIFYKEKSLQNFQAWLLLPMQMYGLCWP